MTDIFREVDEDLRRERAAALWKKYGNYVIGLAVVIVVATFAIVQWRNWQQQRAAATGDQFMNALELLNNGKRAEAEAAFGSIVSGGTGSYPVLAAFGLAGAKAANTDIQGAVAAFDAIAANTANPQAIRDIAKLRAALLLADSANLADLERRIGDLAVDKGVFRLSAREILGLAAWRMREIEAARKYFGQIIADRDVSDRLQQRASAILALIRAEVGEPPATAGSLNPGGAGALAATPAARAN
ncbi:MAG: tetratricopeptide repeat protein [Bauldia sp.]